MASEWESTDIIIKASNCAKIAVKNGNPFSATERDCRAAPIQTSRAKDI